MSRYILSTVFIRSASILLNFLLALLIVRVSGPEVKGEVTLIITVVSLYVFFSNILGGQALVYLFSRNIVEVLLVTAYIWTAFVCVTGFVLMRYSGFFSANHSLSISVLAFFSGLISIHQTVLFGAKKIPEANFLAITPVVIQLTGVVICLFFLNVKDEYAFIYSTLIALLPVCLYSFFKAFQIVSLESIFSKFSWVEVTTSFKYGFSFQIAEVLQFLNLRYYYFQLGLQQGTQYLGIYSIGISILEAVWVIPRSIATVRYIAVANSEKLSLETKRTTRLVRVTLVFCSLILLIISLVPPEFYVKVFGKDFNEIRHSMRFLFPGILVYCIYWVISSFYLGIGRYTPLIVSHTVGVVVMAGTGFYLLPKYVMSGAGLTATLSFTAATAVLVLFFTQQKGAVLTDLIPGYDDLRFLRTLLFVGRKT